MRTVRVACPVRVARPALAALLLGMAAANAADGDLDPAFGTGGYVLPELARTTFFAMALRPDGRILACGSHPASPETLSGEFVVAQFLADGTPDPGFGTNGFAFVDFGGADDACGAIAIQPDGRIVAAGTSSQIGPLPTYTYTPLVARLTPQGGLDTTFGDGTGRASYPSLSHATNAVALQSDGKIVFAGWKITGSQETDFSVVRTWPDGSPDTTFGSGGVVTAGFGQTQTTDVAYAIAVDGQGRIVVAGSVDANGAATAGIVRLLDDGGFDGSFGDGGMVTVGGNTATSLVLQHDGRILVGGSHVVSSSDWDAGAVRLLDDGDVDATFGTQGLASVPLAPGGVHWSSSASAVAVQDDGRIVLAGDTSDPDLRKFATVSRLDADGHLDPSFADAGTALLASIDTARPHQHVRAVVLSAGHVVGAGYVDSEDIDTGTAGMLVRLQSDLIFLDGF